MRKNIAIFISTIVLLLCLTTTVFADSVVINSKKKKVQKTQVLLLEQALAPKEPLTAVKRWAEGVKTRNGALQYAVMSQDLKKESYSNFVDLNWSTGTSSPWVESYKITEKVKVDNKRFKFEVEFTYTDSIKSKFSTKECVTVNKFGGIWLISSIEKIEAGEGVDKVELDSALPQSIKLKYDNIALENISLADNLSSFKKLEDRELGTINGKNIIMTLYSDSKNSIHGVFQHGGQKYVLRYLGYSHDINSVEAFNLQLKYKNAENNTYLLSAVGSQILGYQYIFFDETNNRWLSYRNWGIPKVFDMNKDGTNEVLMQFKGMHNNAPDGNILAFSKGRFTLSSINAAVYKNSKISKETNKIGTTFKETDGEFFVEVDIYGNNNISSLYSLEYDRLVSLNEEPEQRNLITYRNTQYGFKISLPGSWKDYNIVSDKWEGLSAKDSERGRVVETGQIIYIRHPRWTSEEPRQDIPIMVFTLEQWDLLQQEEFHIGAAPMRPKELGRNSRYVFALPARYNYAFPAGYEEVERILESNPLKPLKNTRSKR